MKISIILPTRNRLEYLKHAVKSVLLQDYEDWEMIISDNDSVEDIQGYVKSLAEPRIKYSKTDGYVSVTENWNRALNLSTGEYIILIGDDDCIMKGSFKLINELTNQFQKPELIFSNGLQYLYPGINPAYPNGNLITIGNWDPFNSTQPKIVEIEKIRDLGDESLNFRLLFSFNLQLLTLHRSIIEKLKINGNFFHSPYPDFYAMTLLFKVAKKVLFCPYPLVTVGICPKSFGALYINHEEDKGIEALNINKEINAYPELEKYLLPGSKLYTYWLFALYTIKKNFGNQIDIKINFRRFRELQLFDFLRKFRNAPNKKKLFLDYFKKLTFAEKFRYGPLMARILINERKKPGSCLEMIDKLIDEQEIHRGHKNFKFKNEYHSISQVIDEITPTNCESNFKLSKI